MIEERQRREEVPPEKIGPVMLAAAEAHRAFFAYLDALLAASPGLADAGPPRLDEIRALPFPTGLSVGLGDGDRTLLSLSYDSETVIEGGEYEEDEQDITLGPLLPAGIVQTGYGLRDALVAYLTEIAAISPDEDAISLIGELGQRAPSAGVAVAQTETGEIAVQILFAPHREGRGQA